MHRGEQMNYRYQTGCRRLDRQGVTQRMPNADNWPNYSLGPKEHLHAVGVLIAAWEHVEIAYQTLVQLVLPARA